MRVIAFSSSPRKEGNSETLAAEVLRGAAAAGAWTELVRLNTLTIRPCQACDACRKLKRCRIEDDMQPLYAKLLEADAIVLATPIYYWGISAQLKGFIDRWYAIDQEGLREPLAGKPLLLICAHADGDPHTADGAVFSVRTAAQWLKFKWLPPLLAVAGDKGEIAKKPAVMQDAFERGRTLVA
jgi:multimeric flavodoxin WrbA